MKGLYVIQFNNGMYWGGHYTLVDNVRKALIYASLTQAKKQAQSSLKINNTIAERNHVSIREVSSCKILEISIIKKETIEQYGLLEEETIDDDRGD